MNYAELGEICSKLKGQPFEVVAFPCNQFLKQESKSDSGVLSFIKGKMEPFGADYVVMKPCHVNGTNTHPVWSWLRYNSMLRRDGTGTPPRILPISWNFAKFLVDKEGRVYSYYSTSIKPSQMEADIMGLLDGTLQGVASLPATVNVPRTVGLRRVRTMIILLAVAFFLRRKVGPKIAALSIPVLARFLSSKL